MSVKNFENRRWGGENQKISFRHKTAFEMITAISDNFELQNTLNCHSRVGGNPESASNTLDPRLRGDDRKKSSVIQSNKEISVLDLGCGDGLLLSLLKDNGIIGKGLDISDEAVAKTKNKGFEASVSDFSDRLPFADKTFDVVVSLDVLEHLYNPENLLKEANRVSKRFVIIGVPNFNSLPARIQVLFGMVPENNRPKKGHVYWFNYFVLEKMVCESNFILKELRVNAIMENRFLIGKLFKLLAKIRPSLFALSFVVKLEKEVI